MCDFIFIFILQQTLSYYSVIFSDGKELSTSVSLFLLNSWERSSSGLRVIYKSCWIIYARGVGGWSLNSSSYSYFVRRSSELTTSESLKGGNTSRCRCYHPSLTLRSLASIDWFVLRVPLCTDKGRISHTVLPALPIVILFHHRRISKRCRRLALFSENSLICLYCSSVIPRTLMCPVVPGESSSASLTHLHGVFGLFQKTLSAWWLIHLPLYTLAKPPPLIGTNAWRNLGYSLATTECCLSKTVICGAVRNNDPLTGTLSAPAVMWGNKYVPFCHVPSCVRSHRSLSTVLPLLSDM